jgi:uncharacterized membrane protein
MNDNNSSRFNTRLWRLFKNQLSLYRWLLLALLIGLALRLPGLSSRPMWYDEAFSVLFSSTGPKSMVYGTLTPVGEAAADVHPLFYYSLLWGWMKLFGTSAFAVRFMSVLIGLGIILAGWRLAADLFNRTVANLAAVFIALSSYEVHYAQEARMYALLALACILTAIFYRRGLESDRWRHWIGFGLSAALAMYSHILAGGVLLAIGISWFIWHRGQKSIKFLSGVVLAVLIYAPWLLQLPAQMGKVEQAYWIERPGILELVQTALVFVTDLPLEDFLLPVGLFLAILLLGLVIWGTGRAYRSRHPHFSQAAWMGFLTLAPVGIIFGVSQIRPVFILRGLLPSVSFFLVWLAWAMITVSKNKMILGMLVIVFIVSSGMGLLSRWDYDGFPYAPYSEVADFIHAQLEPADTVLHSNKLTMLPMVYVAPGMDQGYMADIRGTGSDTLALPTQEVLGLLAVEDIDVAIGDSDRIYFVVFEREISEYLALGEEQHPHLARLEMSFEIIEVSEWGELRVYVFQR